jgi:sporulation protein YlmC with PRC-barrel domain
MKKIYVIGAALLFGIAFSSGALAAEKTESKTQIMQQEKMENTLQTSAEQQLGSTRNLIGETVVGQKGEKIGDISNLMVDNNTGQIDFVILSPSGILGMTKEQYIVPWKALHHDSATKAFSLKMSETMLKDAPRGETVATREQATKIYQFYGVAPSWEERGPNMQQMDIKEAPMMKKAPMMQEPRTITEEPKK